MSRRTSPSTRRPYGIARVVREWELSRSTLYAQRAREAQPAAGHRGRTSTLDDAALLTQIRAVIAESPFHGEGHRKIWARLLTLKGVRTSMRRVLRVMRAAELLAPARQPAPVVEPPHEGTIVTDRPNMMWGTDATAAVTIRDGAATIFAAIAPRTPVNVVESFEVLARSLLWSELWQTHSSVPDEKFADNTAPRWRGFDRRSSSR